MIYKDIDIGFCTPDDFIRGIRRNDKDVIRARITLVHYDTIKNTIARATGWVFLAFESLYGDEIDVVFGRNVNMDPEL